MFVIFRSFSNVASDNFCKSKSVGLAFRRYLSMKLYTDRFNPFTLRILVADQLAGTGVSVQHVQNDNGMYIFIYVIVYLYIVVFSSEIMLYYACKTEQLSIIKYCCDSRVNAS